MAVKHVRTSQPIIFNSERRIENKNWLNCCQKRIKIGRKCPVNSWIDLKYVGVRQTCAQLFWICVIRLVSKQNSRMKISKVVDTRYISSGGHPNENRQKTEGRLLSSKVIRSRRSNWYDYRERAFGINGHKMRRIWVIDESAKIKRVGMRRPAAHKLWPVISALRRRLYCAQRFVHHCLRAARPTRTFLRRLYLIARRRIYPEHIF